MREGGGDDIEFFFASNKEWWLRKSRAFGFWGVVNRKSGIGNWFVLCEIMSDRRCDVV
jgi:hypothetical protein